MSFSTKKILTLLLTLSLSGFLTAQESRINPKVYSVKIYRTDQNKTENLIFHSVTDTSVILITDQELRLLLNNEPYNKTEYKYSEIRRISIRQKNNLLKSTAKGATIGLISGAALATVIILTDEPSWVSNEMIFLVTTLSGTVTVALNGVIIGLIKENHQIDFDKNNFQKFKKKYSERQLIE